VLHRVRVRDQHDRRIGLAGEQAVDYRLQPIEGALARGVDPVGVVGLAQPVVAHGDEHVSRPRVGQELLVEQCPVGRDLVVEELPGAGLDLAAPGKALVDQLAHEQRLAAEEDDAQAEPGALALVHRHGHIDGGAKHLRRHVASGMRRGIAVAAAQVAASSEMQCQMHVR